MKNSFYIRTVKLFLVSGLSLLAFHSFANAQARNEDEFKVELKPNSTATTSKAEAKAEANAVADTKTRVEIKPDEEHPVVTDVKKVVAENTEKTPVVQPAPAPSPTPAPEVKAVVNPEPPVTAQAPSPVSAKKALVYNRDIQIVEGQAVYIVNGRAPHLYMVSRDLYGSDRMWKAIADWNALKAPYDLSPGQKLVLKKAPTVSNAEADRILLKQWAQMDRWDIIKGIILAQQGQSIQAEEPIAPAAGLVLPAPPPESHEEEAAPAASVTPAQAPHTAHHGHWKFKTAVVLSYFTLQNNNNDVPVDNEFNSELDYGIELEAAYHFNDRTEFIIGAAVEKMDIAHSEEESEIEGHAQYLAKYSLGFETKLSPRIIGAGYAIYEQNPVAEPTLDGANIEAIFIPQIQAGFRWGLFERGSFSSWLITDGIYAFKASKNDIDLKEGGGFLAGFKFANDLGNRTLTYGVSYRELKQDTETSTNAIKTFYGNIGLIW